MSTKKLGIGALTGLVLGSMIGGGVFSLPQNFAVVTGPGALLLGWCITAIGIFSLSKVFQELNRLCPELEGGVYSYARAGFGKLLGFQTAWGYWFSAWIGSISYFIILFSALGTFFPAFGTGNNLVSILGASLLLWSTHFIVLKGVKEASSINTGLTLIKLCVIIFFILAAIKGFDASVFMSDFWGQTHRFPATPRSVFDQIKHTMLITNWVFLGFEGATLFAGYAKKRSDIGKAILFGLSCCLLLYVMVSSLSMGILSQQALLHLKHPSMAGVLEYILGPWGKNFVLIGVIISAAGALLAWMLFASEIPAIAARDDLFPKKLCLENNKGTPIIPLWLTSLAIQACLVCVYLYEAGYQMIFSLATAAILLPYLLSAGYGLKLATQFRKNNLPTLAPRLCFYSSLGFLYIIWLCYAAGAHMLYVSLLFVPGIICYIFYHGRTQGTIACVRHLNRYEIVFCVSAIVTTGCTLVLLYQGNLSLT